MFGRLKKILVVGAVLITAGTAGWFVAGYYIEGRDILARIPFINSRDRTDRQAEERRSEKPGQDLQVRVYLPQEGGVREEERRIPAEALSVRLAEYLVTEYLRLLPERLNQTKILGVYKDRDNILYLDLSDDFRRNFSGDAKQEFHLLKSLYDTISRNIPAVQDVMLLSEGREIETLGGHFSLHKPLKAVFGEGSPQ